MSRAQLFSDENAQRRTVNSWTEAASATHDDAVATREGVSNVHHHVTGIHAGFTSSGGLQTQATTLTLTLGADTGDTLEFVVVDAFTMSFDPPLRCPEGEDVVATLADGGSNVVGAVVLVGFSL